jgi:hypothetical protein
MTVTREALTFKLYEICHSERSEESSTKCKSTHCTAKKILRYTQNDKL